MSKIRVGVDAGGTFTDFVAVGPGWQRTLKLPSRPEDPGGLVRDALSRLLPTTDASIELVFSTTAATNAVLQRSGAAILLTTAGFEDVLEIGRQARPALYALEPERTPPLVAATDRIGVRERVDAHGNIIVALDDDELDRVIALLHDRDPSTPIAICFLHAYAAPTHERRLAQRLRQLGWRVSLSSEVCPLPREYERTSTTVIDAYVTPMLGETLASLDIAQITLRVMESSGGARRGAVVRPARTVLSGPAAGVIAAEALAQRLDLSIALALDMGGTSTDVALLRDGRAARVDEFSIAGLPVALPSVGVRSVGAGGGSIAWIDGGGALKVGPRSAGATPGPAAYGRGGLEPTVTDAHVVLGHLGRTLCGGSIGLRIENARAALEPIAAMLGASIEAAAYAIIAVADATIVRAARTASVGESPAAIIAYGGAAGLHAVAVARALGVARVIIPAAPGLRCALGALSADVVVDEIVAWGRVLDEHFGATATKIIDAMAAKVEAALDLDRVVRRRIEKRARARYVGQGVDGELELPLPITHEDFHAAHEAAYGHRLARDIEVTSLRVRGIGVSDRSAVVEARSTRWPRIGTRDGIAIYARDRLRIGQPIVGPAIVEELSATVLVPAGSSAVRMRDDTLSLSY